MRLGLDFDGVIADTIPAMIAYARLRLGIELTPTECIVPEGIERLGVVPYRALVAATHDTTYSLTFEPTAGATEGLRSLAKRHELFIVTAREGAAFANAERWIEAHGLRTCFAAVRSSAGPRKSQMVDDLRLECFVDDVPRTFRNWSARAWPLLWTAEHNRDHPVEAPTVRVAGWEELAELLAPMSSAPIAGL